VAAKFFFGPSFDRNASKLNALPPHTGARCEKASASSISLAREKCVRIRNHYPAVLRESKDDEEYRAVRYLSRAHTRLVNSRVAELLYFAFNTLYAARLASPHLVLILAIGTSIIPARPIFDAIYVE